MVKNYLVTALRPISSIREHGDDSINLYLDYQEMYKMSIASFKHFVEEPFETIIWSDPAKDVNSSTYQNWIDIRNLWNSEPCNIFWAGADTLMLKKTKIFSDRFPEYRMFNYTDPKSHAEVKHYFNDDLRYYPHTMSTDIWQLGEDLFKKRNEHLEKNWGFDQIRHNAMFWNQSIPDSDRLHPYMAYQAMNLRSLSPEMVQWHNNWNGITLDTAHILHFHGSRGSKAVINFMRELCTKLDIIYE